MSERVPPAFPRRREGAIRPALYTSRGPVDTLPASLRSLPLVSRYTYRKQMQAEVLIQVAAGAAGAHFDLVARKEFGASADQISVIYLASHLLFLFTAFRGAAVARRSKRTFLGLTILFGPAVLLLTPLAEGAWQFVAIASLSSLYVSIMVPYRNRLLQANYLPARRGESWGRIYAVSLAASLATTLLCGGILDADPEAFRITFPASAAVSAAGVYLYSRIRLRRGPVQKDVPGGWRQTVTLWRSDRPFMRFEAFFMMYGLAFMLLLPVSPILVHDALGLSYTASALLRQVLPTLIVTAVLPLAGRLTDRTSPVHVARVAFSILCAYPLLLIAGIRWDSMPLVVAGFAVSGLGMAFLHTAWELGPTWFAGKGESSSHMAFHVACVGLRGSTGPFLGSRILAASGLPAAYAVSAALFGAAALGMGTLARATRKKDDPAP